MTTYQQTQLTLTQVAAKAIARDYSVSITVRIDRFTHIDESRSLIHVSNLDLSLGMTNAVAQWVYDNYSHVPANALTFEFVRVY